MTLNFEGEKKRCLEFIAEMGYRIESIKDDAAGVLIMTENGNCSKFEFRNWEQAMYYFDGALMQKKYTLI